MTVVYFVVLALATVAVAAPLRNIWRGADADDDSDPAAPHVEGEAQGKDEPPQVAGEGVEMYRVQGGRAQGAELRNPLQITLASGQSAARDTVSV